MLLSPTQVPTGTEPGHPPAPEGYKPPQSLIPLSSLTRMGELIKLALGALPLGSRALLPAQTLSAWLRPPGAIHYLLPLIGSDCSGIVTWLRAGGGHRARATRTIWFSGPGESPSKVKHKKRLHSCKSPHPSSAAFLPLPFRTPGKV